MPRSIRSLLVVISVDKRSDSCRSDACVLPCPASTPANMVQPMPQTTTGINADDAILAQFFLDREKATDPAALAALVAQYSAQYPHLADQFHDLPAMQGQLSAAASFDKLPERQFARDEILGDYKIVRLIGVGGMGEIYEARQISLDRSVALKVMRKDRANAEAQARFRRERAVLAKLHQTNIVPVYAAGREGDIEYFAMQYIDGATLWHVLQALRGFLRLPTLRGVGDRAGVRGLSSTPPLTDLVSSMLNERTPDIAQPTGSVAAQPAQVNEPSKEQPIRLSMAYWRSVAQALAEAADAVDYAHQQGIIHRDLKPSNLMLDRTGRCHVIDFGLANDPGSPQRKQGNGETLACALGSEETALNLLQSQAMGTQSYMAPEQFDGKYDARTDVWGLGVVLHEMLTLNRPYNGDIRKAQASKATDSLPADLSAICGKALHCEADSRYSSAKAFGDDLKHWLHYEPTVARGARPLRRAGLWARRNPGWAVAVVFALMSIVASAMYLRNAMTTAKQESNRSEENRRLIAAAHKEQTLRLKEATRNAAIMDIRNGPLGGGAPGYRDKGFEGLLSLGRVDSIKGLQDLAVGLLEGLDAKRIDRFDHEAGGLSSIAFSPDGKRLMTGGWTGESDRAKRYPGYLRSDKLLKPKPTRHGGTGPVAFRFDGAVLQVVPPTDQRPTVLVWNVDRDEAAAEFPLPGKNAADVKAIALSTDANHLAVAEPKSVAVWNVRTRERVALMPTEATALAFAPNLPMLAVGAADGTIAVWLLPNSFEREMAIATAIASAGAAVRPKEAARKLLVMRAARSAIGAMAFGRLPKRTAAIESSMPSPGWLLAVAASGAPEIAVWDLDRQIPFNHFRGSEHTIHALAFSPDGTILASTGRTGFRLWDVLSASLLLNSHKPYSPDNRNWLTGIAFSPDGTELALTSVAMFGSRGGLDIWKLENGRGIRTLRGLSGQLGSLVPSPDERWLAAISHSWEVAVWDARTGQIRHLFAVPMGRYVDNAVLAFSQDGRKLAYAGSNAARLWSMEQGNEEGAWQLSFGLGNRLAFGENGALTLFRWHNDGTPFHASALERDGKTRRLFQFDGFEREIVAKVTPDSRVIVVDGYDNADETKRRVIATDVATGKKKWDHHLPPDRFARNVTIDSLGVYAQIENAEDVMFFDMQTGKLLVDPPNTVDGALSRHDKLDFSPGNLPLGGWWLIDRETKQPLVRIGGRTQGAAIHAEFSRNGRHVYVGYSDGSVVDYDLEKVRVELTKLGLQW